MIPFTSEERDLAVDALIVLRSRCELDRAVACTDLIDKLQNWDLP